MKEQKRLYGLIGSVAPSLIAIIVGLLFGFVILLVSNPSQAVRGIGIILAGGFNGGAQPGQNPQGGQNYYDADYTVVDDDNK